MLNRAHRVVNDLAKLSVKIERGAVGLFLIGFSHDMTRKCAPEIQRRQFPDASCILAASSCAPCLISTMNARFSLTNDQLTILAQSRL